MHPDLIYVETILGTVVISSYAFFLYSSMIVMGVGLYALSRSHNYSKLLAMGISIGMMIVALIGARIMHILTNWSVYRTDSSHMYSLDLHGLSIFGAIIGVGTCVFFVGYMKRVSLWKKADFLVPYAGASIVLARIGCFLNGCCFGVVTQMPWGVRFPLFSDAHMSQLAHGQTNLLVSLNVHPTQLYEAIGVCIATIAAMRLRYGKRFKSGDTLVVFTGIYFATRFVIHFFRVYPESFSTAYLFPFFYGGIGICCFIYVLFFGA